MRPIRAMHSRRVLFGALVFLVLFVLAGLAFFVQQLIATGPTGRGDEPVFGPLIVDVLLVSAGMAFLIPITVAIVRRLRGPRLP